MAEQSGVPVAVQRATTDRFGIPVPSASGEVDIVRHGRHVLHDASRHGDATAMADACLDLVEVFQAQHRALAATWALEDTIARIESLPVSPAVTAALATLRARLG